MYDNFLGTCMSQDGIERSWQISLEEQLRNPWKCQNCNERFESYQNLDEHRRKFCK